MKKLVIRDELGSIVNIGPWESDTELPDNYTSKEEEVTVDSDGGIHVSTDYSSLRRSEYPNLVDQLDALWKGGDHLDEMRSLILLIKDKYPKDGI